MSNTDTQQNVKQPQWTAGYVKSELNDAGDYDYSLNVTVNGHVISTNIERESAIAIAKSSGTIAQDTGTGTIVSLNSNAVANIIKREFPDVELKAVNIDTNSHTNGNVNVEADKTYTVNMLAPSTTTDWETTVSNSSSNTETGQNSSSVNTGGNSGSGNGSGNGVGDGTDNSVSSDDQPNSSSNNNVAQTTEVIKSGTVIDDKTAAASYSYAVSNGAINNIFHNSHYQDDPVPAWSFSVDFVPLCMSDKRFKQIYSFEDSKTLTKAVLNITANEKTINTQSINYLGLQHPFFTKLAQSHGDLKITFAEDELFTISTILNNVLNYASYLSSFPTNNVYEVIQGDWSDRVIAHAASDTVSPKYRLNATDLSIADQNTAALVHNYKFVFDILLKIYKPSNAHAFADESAVPGFVYHFHNCWLKNIAGIELNYDDDSPIDRPVIFSYQYMSSTTYYEFATRNKAIATI